MAENHHTARLQPPALAAFLLLAAIVAGFYWKLILTDQYTWLAGDDIASQVLPWLQFQAGEFHSGRFPLWDPSHWAGQPLPGQAQPGTLSPLNWLLYSLPLRDGWIKQAHLHAYFLLIHLLAAWFAYLLARAAGAARPGSILAGVVFTLSGWMGQTEWPQMLNSAIWAPLTALFLLNFLDSAHWRHAAFSGFFLGVAWLGGHHQIPIFLSSACLVFWAWALWRDWRCWPSAALFWILAFLAGAAQILPALEYGRLAVRWVGVPDPVGWQDKVPYSVHIAWSTSPAGLIGFLVPFAFTHTSPFLGFVSLSMAVLGAVWNWRRRAVRILVLVALLGLLLASVHYTPLHGLFYALVPMVEKARNPTTALFLCTLAAAPLAALGFTGLSQHKDSPWLRRVIRFALAFSALVFATRLVIMQLKGYPGIGEQRDLEIASVALASAALLAAFRSGHIGLAVLHSSLIFLALCEFTGHAGVFFPNVKTEPARIAKLTAMAAHGDIAAYLRRQPGLFRIDVDEQAVPYNFGDWHGLHQTGGYLASVTGKIYHAGAHNPEIRNLLGVAYRISNEPHPQFPELVFTGSSGLKVWRNPSALPRVFGESPECVSARPVAYHPGYIRIAAQVSCPTALVFSENHYPGWRAAIDGKPAPVKPAHGFLLSVDVPAGPHWIEFRYRPLSVYLGLALSALALLIALVILKAPPPLRLGMSD